MQAWVQNENSEKRIVASSPKLKELAQGSKKPPKKKTAIDLFSGCGGLSLGLKNAGFKILAAVDSDSLACRTYRLNHKKTFLLEKDITKTRPTYLRKRLSLEPGELDLLAGCPPCQGFSTLRTLNGKESVEDPINDLVFQFLKYTRVFLPKAIMMENVPGLAKDSRLEKLINKIAAIGYRSEARVMDAWDYGTPQRRKRMVMIAVRNGEPVFAERRKRKPTVSTAIRKLLRSGSPDDPLHNYEVNRAKHVVKLIEKVPLDGGSRTDLPDEEQLECHKRCDGFSDIYGRMSWGRPAPTITGGCINPSKGRFIHPEEHRAITLREAAMLQGFPQSYCFDMSSGRYPVAQLIGNAFPPKFAEHHATALLKEISAARK